MLVIGEKDGHFIINDPGHVDATNLDYYDNNFETRGFVGDPPGDMSALDISVGNADEVLVVDPLGRQTGYDPASGGILEGIPQSAHFADCIENSDLTGLPGTNTAHQIEIYQPLPGNYQVFLIGKNAGAYQLALRSYLADGTQGNSLSLPGSSTQITFTSYQVNLGTSGVTLQPFTNKYSWTVSPTNGPLPVTVQFTAPPVDSAGNTVTNWYWTFGDGTISTDSNPSHTYQSGGIFFPSVFALDDAGNSMASFGPSVVLPTVSYAVNLAAGEVPLTVQFNATNIDSSGRAVSSWTWDFGDGSGDSGQNPAHMYTATGTFQPTIVTTDDIGLAVSSFGPAVIVSVPVNHLGLVLNGDFESDDFTGWTLGGDAFDYSFVDDGTGFGGYVITPHSGICAAALGTLSSSGSISQTLATTAGAGYLLSLWLDSPDGATPNEFLVSWNGHTLFDQSNIGAIGLTNLQFAVRATGTSTVLQFRFQNEPSYFGLDDVSVVPLTQILGISLVGTNMVVNGSNGQSGSTCVTLMSTDLTLDLSQWTPVATNILNTDGGFTFTATNVVDAHAPRRFYILQMQ